MDGSYRVMKYNGQAPVCIHKALVQYSSPHTIFILYLKICSFICVCVCERERMRERTDLLMIDFFPQLSPTSQFPPPPTSLFDYYFWWLLLKFWCVWVRRLKGSYSFFTSTGQVLKVFRFLLLDLGFVFMFVYTCTHVEEGWPNKTKFVCSMISLVIFLGFSKLFWKYLGNTNPQMADIEDLSAGLVNPFSCLLLIHSCIGKQSASVEGKSWIPQSSSVHLRRGLRVKSHFSEDWLLVPRPLILFWYFALSVDI